MSNGMPHSDHDGPLVKRKKLAAQALPVASRKTKQGSRIFAPFRTVGLVSPTEVPFTSIPLGKTTFQITTSVGRSLQTYDLKRGLNLVFLTRPQVPADITATYAWRENVLAAWGSAAEAAAEARRRADAHDGTSQGVWVFRRGRKVGELEMPHDLNQPIRQILVFGSWIVGCAVTRIEVWKTSSLEHYTTLHSMAAAGSSKGSSGGNELTGGICNMPTYLNKIFVGRRDGWVQIWNVSTGKLIYTILPPSPDAGAVTCLEATPALSLLAIAYSRGPLVIQNVLTDRAMLQLDAGTEDEPVRCISFRSDGKGAGLDGNRDGVMATATAESGDITFWDLNKGGRVMGVLRSAHNPPAAEGDAVRGGVSKIEFPAGQPVIVTSGNDNSLKTWIFDETPFSPVPRILHMRSGHAAPVTCLQFLPSDFDGADGGNKWLLSGGRDRSLWGWSLRRDGQSTELSQGSIRKKAKKYGILSGQALRNGPTTTLEDLKAPEITCIACSLNRDGGIGAIPGKQPMWQKTTERKPQVDAEVSGMTGWESVVTAHKDDAWARTWFWGRKRAGRWAFRTGDGTNVSTVAISPCGTFAVVGSGGGSIDMFNLQSGQHRQRFPSKLTPAQARQLKAQQLRQADDVAVLQARRAKLQFAPGTGKHTSAITGLVVDSMNKLVVSCSSDGRVKFWDFLTGNLVDQMDWSTNAVSISGSRYHAANDLVAFACGDDSVRVVDMETKRTVREFRGARDAITDFCFSNDGRWMVVASLDGVLRVYDLPTGHLIDGVRFERPCLALAFSATGEYLATASAGSLGVHIWTNKALFRHVPTRQISEVEEMDHVAGPTASGESGQGLVDAAFDAEEDGPAEDDYADLPLGATVDQLNTDMMTLSLVPRSRWQTLLQLDAIKQRNKPKEPPKAPEKAPFFLPSLNGPSTSTQSGEAITQEADQVKSRITQLEGTRAEEAFTAKLREGAASGNYDAFIEHLKSLSPSTADLELRSLSAGDGSDGSTRLNEPAHFVRALTRRLAARRDFELAQAWMTVFLRLHFDLVMAANSSNGHADTDAAGDKAARDELLAELREWRAVQASERDRLGGLVGYCAGVVGFLRSPRT